jgi:hypothetical protein
MSKQVYPEHPIISRITFTKQEEKVIRKCCNLQLGTLRELLSPQYDDVLLYASYHEHDKTELEYGLETLMDHFMDLNTDPAIFPSLPAEVKGTIIYILERIKVKKGLFKSLSNKIRWVYLSESITNPN